MKIVVCVKQVPSSTKVSLDPNTYNLKSNGSIGIMNTYDKNAIEVALSLREYYGGQVIILSMGPEENKKSIIEGISMGVDYGILLSSKSFAGSDTLATSYILSQAIKKIGGVDLVLFGKQTIDSDTGQVGPITAEFLDLPQITNIIDIIGLGRGASDTETIKIAFEVPNKINAQVGVTRPLTELDIFSIQNQIGQSGHTVKPIVIINLGIQGANQFTTGMDKADLIISINSDRNAPIFDISDYAYAGDVKEFLTELHL